MLGQEWGYRDGLRDAPETARQRSQQHAIDDALLRDWTAAEADAAENCGAVIDALDLQGRLTPAD